MYTKILLHQLFNSQITTEKDDLNTQKINYCCIKKFKNRIIKYKTFFNFNVLPKVIYFLIYFIQNIFNYLYTFQNKNNFGISTILGLIRYYLIVKLSFLCRYNFFCIIFISGVYDQLLGRLFSLEFISEKKNKLFYSQIF